jgi:hypothetical protein
LDCLPNTLVALQINFMSPMAVNNKEWLSLSSLGKRLLSLQALIFAGFSVKETDALLLVSSFANLKIAACTNGYHKDKYDSSSPNNRMLDGWKWNQQKGKVEAASNFEKFAQIKRKMDERYFGIRET